MRVFLIYCGIIILISACQRKNPEALDAGQTKIHEVVAIEVLQTSEYTYLLVKEGDKEQWLAGPKMIAEVGKTYFYQGGMEMNDFNSKELGRTFESVIFLEEITTDRDALGENQSMPASHTMKGSTGKAIVEKINVEIDPAEGGITLSELFSNKESYSGKTVKIKGKVTKFNSAIMGKNWIHIQDGTEHKGAYDLTVTSDIQVNVGDTVVFEGKIALNKDFGYGYFYEVIMEEGVLK